MTLVGVNVFIHSVEYPKSNWTSVLHMFSWQVFVLVAMKQMSLLLSRSLFDEVFHVFVVQDFTTTVTSITDIFYCKQSIPTGIGYGRLDGGLWRSEWDTEERRGRHSKHSRNIAEEDETRSDDHWCASSAAFLLVFVCINNNNWFYLPLLTCFPGLPDTVSILTWLCLPLLMRPVWLACLNENAWFFYVFIVHVAC